MFHPLRQIALVLLLATPLLAAKKGIGLQLVPDQLSEISDVHDAAPKFACDNWGWAAVIESMLLYRNVPLQQQYWINKGFNNNSCATEALDYRQLAALIDNDYYLEDQRRLRLENRFYPGGSISPDALIMAIREQRPLLLVWKKHPYLLYGVAYDEYIGPNGTRLFMIQKMRLADPLGVPRDRRFVVFDRSVDDIKDIEGIMDIVVLPPNVP